MHQHQGQLLCLNYRHNKSARLRYLDKALPVDKHAQKKQISLLKWSSNTQFICSSRIIKIIAASQALSAQLRNWIFGLRDDEMVKELVEPIILIRNIPKKQKDQDPVISDQAIFELPHIRT